MMMMMMIIIILVFWYAKQTVMVRWGDAMSDPFHVTNSVSQGGILSPFVLMYIWMSCPID